MQAFDSFSGSNKVTGLASPSVELCNISRVSLGSPWVYLGGSLGVPGGSLGVRVASLGDPGAVPGGTKNGGTSPGASWDGPGKPSGCF